MPTMLPAFADPVHDAQQTFRALLDAMAQPGRCCSLPELTPPPGLTSACAAACLTLLDNEVTLWLEDSLQNSRPWLQFHTGCPLAPSPQADFALTRGEAIDLSAFNIGTAEYPEASATLLLQVTSLTGGPTVALRGPGILDQRAIAPQVPAGFWTQWRENAGHYPMGVDVFLLGETQVMGLPRTAEVILTP
ncbi:MAG: phosphonate C-P lyase system protein PhnH [Elainellaceae cyanobacterium]